MVNNNDIYIVTNTVAILHEPPQLTAVDVKELESIISPPINNAITAFGMMLSSQRDQIEIIVSNTKTDFRDMSGRHDFISDDKLGKLIDYFVKKFKIVPHTYGINFIVKVSHKEPDIWVLSQLISSSISDKIREKINSGTGSFSFDSGQSTCNLKFEPKDKDSLEVNYNATVKNKKLPSVIALRKARKKNWDSFLNILKSLELTQR